MDEIRFWVKAHAAALQADRIRPLNLPSSEKEQHALRYVDDDAVIDQFRHDVAVVDVQLLRDLQACIGRQVVAARQSTSSDAESSADSGKRVARLHRVNKFLADNLVRQKRAILGLGADSD